MTLASLENEIMYELRSVTGVADLTKTQLMEWSTGEVKPQEGETLYRLPRLKVNCSVKLKPAQAKRLEKREAAKTDKKVEG